MCSLGLARHHDSECPSARKAVLHPSLLPQGIILCRLPSISPLHTSHLLFSLVFTPTRRSQVRMISTSLDLAIVTPLLHTEPVVGLDLEGDLTPSDTCRIDLLQASILRDSIRKT